MTVAPAFEQLRQFRAAPGAMFSDKQADQYGRFLEEKAGLGQAPVSAERVVELAKPKRSPIHKQVFDMPVEAAAHEHYLANARHLIRHIVTDVPLEGGETITTRAFHHVVVAGDDGPVAGYTSQRVVWRNQEMTPQIVAKALAELRTWRRRYAQYGELSFAFEKIDEVLGEEDKAA
jgi:hypothetical protein